MIKNDFVILYSNKKTIEKFKNFTILFFIFKLFTIKLFVT